MKRIVCLQFLVGSAALVMLTSVSFADDAPAPRRQSWLPPADVLSGESESEGPGTLQVVASTMANISDDLHAEKTDAAVQAKQKQVTGSLDAMIASLEKQMAKGGGAGGGMNPSKPMNKSTLAGGPGGIHDLHDPRAGEKQWGALKPKEREQILQSKTDGFPAGYESLLQSYYRRLSSDDASQSPPSAPAAPDGSNGTRGSTAP